MSFGPNIPYRIQVTTLFKYCHVRNYGWKQHTALCIGGNDGGNYHFAKIRVYLHDNT